VGTVEVVVVAVVRREEEEVRPEVDVEADVVVGLAQREARGL
jgi:hypothetical protein